jgi:hypothetical protein
MRLVGIAAVAASVTALSACSSIVEGTTQTLAFDSDPTGAECVLNRNGEVIGNVKTPGALVVKKTKHDINVVCKKDGYEDATALLKSDAAGATFGNILLGGGIGWAIDSASGADNKYTERTTVTMAPIAAAATPAAQAVSLQATPPANVDQLRQLQAQFESGKITDTEYQTKRKELLGN